MQKQTKKHSMLKYMAICYPWKERELPTKDLGPWEKFHPGCLLAIGHASSTRPCVESRLADVVSWLLLKKCGRTVGKSQGVEQALNK